MAVPSSGPLGLYSDIIGGEIGDPQGDNSLHEAAIYAGFSTPDAMSDFYGWSDIIPPSVTTNPLTSVTDSSMVQNGTLTANGGEASNYGFYFGTSSPSAPANAKYSIGTTSSTPTSYSNTRPGLQYARAYYSWAYACNSAGECVGNRCAAGTQYPPFTPQFRTVSTCYCYANCKGSAYYNIYTGGGVGMALNQWPLNARGSSYACDRSDTGAPNGILCLKSMVCLSSSGIKNQSANGARGNNNPNAFGSSEGWGCCTTSSSRLYMAYNINWLPANPSIQGDHNYYVYSNIVACMD